MDLSGVGVVNDEDGGNGRQRTVDEEGVEHHALDIDAEDLRDIRVLRRRLHGAAGAGASQEELQADDGTHRDDEVGDVGNGHGRAEDLHDVLREKARERLSERRIEFLDQFLQLSHLQLS